MVSNTLWASSWALTRMIWEPYPKTTLGVTSMFEHSHPLSSLNSRSVLRDFFGFNLNEHEIITLVRHFRSRDERHQRLPRHLLVSLLQAELKKINFSTFAEVLKTFQAKDVVASGTLPKDVVRHTLVSSCGNPRRSQLKTFAIRDLIDSYLERYVLSMVSI